MSILDTEVLNEIQFHLVEDVDGGLTFSSGLWTPGEVIGYFNRRQYALLKETGILLKRSSSIAAAPGVIRHTIPSDTIAIQRVVWSDGGVYTEVPRSDTFEADHAISGWPTQSVPRPKGYSDGSVPTLTIQTFPPTAGAGVLELLYVFLCTAISNSGIPLTVPDEFAPAIKWGVLADMLSKDGRAQDLERASYCEARYKEGIEAGKLILKGWS